jgi:hypothetical protein
MKKRKFAGVFESAAASAALTLATDRLNAGIKKAPQNQRC